MEEIHHGRASEPSRLHFLDLSAELRNLIYAMIFEHQDPINIVMPRPKDEFSDPGEAALHRRLGDRNLDLHAANGSVCGPLSATIDGDTFPAYQIGLAVLRVCRQVHEEASYLFYSRNTFLVSEDRLGGSSKHGSDCSYTGHVLSSWLHQIGRYRKWVKKIHLDLESFCPMNYDDSTPIKRHCLRMDEDWQRIRSAQHYNRRVYSYNFAACLTTLWSYYLHTTSDLCIVQPALENGKFTYKVTAMSTSLNSIFKDKLDIMKFWRTLCRITLYGDGSSGEIAYWKTEKMSQSRGDKLDRVPVRWGRVLCPETRRDFVLGDDNTLHLLPQSDLPQSIVFKILDHIWQQPVLIDLDNTRGAMDVTALLCISREFRQVYSQRNCFYELALSAAPVQRFLRSMLKLKKLFSTPIFNGKNLSDLNPPILVRFNNPESQINALDFIKATSAAWNDCEITFMLNSGDDVRTTQKDLGWFRKRMRSALEKHKRNLNYEDRSQLLVIVHLDWQGRVNIDDMETRDSTAGSRHMAGKQHTKHRSLIKKSKYLTRLVKRRERWE